MNIAQVMAEVGRLHMENVALRATAEEAAETITALETRLAARRTAEPDDAPAPGAVDDPCEPPTGR